MKYLLFSPISKRFLTFLISTNLYFLGNLKIWQVKDKWFYLNVSYVLNFIIYFIISIGSVPKLQIDPDYMVKVLLTHQVGQTNLQTDRQIHGLTDKPTDRQPVCHSCRKHNLSLPLNYEICLSKAGTHTFSSRFPVSVYQEKIFYDRSTNCA